MKLVNLLPLKEGKHKREEKALEVLQEDGVLEAMDHLENAIDRIKDVHKLLKRKS